MVEFNAENWPLNVQVAFEKWATIPCVKIVTYLISRKGKPSYSAEGIGKILDIPKSTCIHSLKLLIQNGYLTKVQGYYFLNNGIEATNLLVEDEQVPTNPLVEVDQPIGQNSTNPLVANNNKEIKIKNNNKKAQAPVLTFPDWISLNEDLLKSLLDWITQRQNKKQPVTQIALDRIYKKYHEQPERFYAALEYSITNDYRGVFDDPDFLRSKNSKVPKSILDTRAKFEAIDNQ